MLNKQSSASASSLQMYGQHKSTMQSHQPSPKTFNNSSIEQQNVMNYSPTSPATINTPSLSPELMLDTNMSINLDSPTSPSRCSSGNSSRFPPREARRATHIHAEQKRRYNIKNGFDTLHSLIPQLQQNPNAKV